MLPKIHLLVPRAVVRPSPASRIPVQATLGFGPRVGGCLLLLAWLGMILATSQRLPAEVTPTPASGWKLRPIEPQLEKTQDFDPSTLKRGRFQWNSPSSTAANSSSAVHETDPAPGDSSLRPTVADDGVVPASAKPSVPEPVPMTREGRRPNPFEDPFEDRFQQRAAEMDNTEFDPFYSLVGLPQTPEVSAPALQPTPANSQDDGQLANSREQPRAAQKTDPSKPLQIRAQTVSNRREPTAAPAPRSVPTTLTLGSAYSPPATRPSVGAFQDTKPQRPIPLFQAHIPKVENPPVAAQSPRAEIPKSKTPEPVVAVRPAIPVGASPTNTPKAVMVSYPHVQQPGLPPVSRSQTRAVPPPADPDRLRPLPAMVLETLRQDAVGTAQFEELPSEAVEAFPPRRSDPLDEEGELTDLFNSESQTEADAAESPRADAPGQAGEFQRDSDFNRPFENLAPPRQLPLPPERTRKELEQELDLPENGDPTELELKQLPERPKAKEQEQPCDRVYNERNCCEEDEQCREMIVKLRKQTLRDISWDISPPYLPLTSDRERAEKLLRERLAQAPSRSWSNQAGQVLATGRFVGIRYGSAIVKQDSGVEIPLKLAELSADDRCFVAAYWYLPTTCRLIDNSQAIRDWTLTTMTWTASSLCHKPLYFEDVQLERYGHSPGPVVEPFLSGAHFFMNVILLPYNMGLYPPHECQYALGYYRPGSCAPWMIPAFPISGRAVLAEATAIFGIYGIIH